MFDPVKCRQRRCELGLSRARLACRAGVEEVTIWRWESGETVPSVDRYVALAHALRVPFPALLADAADDMAAGELIAAEVWRAGRVGALPTIGTAEQADAEVIADGLTGA